jgi:hypothetical protein
MFRPLEERFVNPENSRCVNSFKNFTIVGIEENTAARGENVINNIVNVESKTEVGLIHCLEACQKKQVSNSRKYHQLELFGCGKSGN